MKQIIISLFFCCGMMMAAKSQSFMMGGGTTLKKNLPFFNIEAGFWEVRNTSFNVHLGLKTRLISVTDTDNEKQNEFEARYTPYLRLGYMLSPIDRRIFSEASLSFERSPEIGLGVYWRLSESGRICLAIIPRVTLGKNDKTLGSYFQLAMGI